MSYLIHPTGSHNVDRLLALANRSTASPMDLIEVYQSARPSHSVEDRLARVRTYLWVQEARELSLCRGESALIATDFISFADRVMSALKQEGELNIQEVDQIKDEMGHPLSGDYREGNDRTVRISLSSTYDLLGDWTQYVTFHELRHWFDIRQGYHRDSYEAEEFRATYFAMKALLVMKRGAPIQWKGATRRRVLNEKLADRKDRLGRLSDEIKELPQNFQPAFDVVWSRVRQFTEEQLMPSYIQKVHAAVRYELMKGEPNPELMEESLYLLQCRHTAMSLIQQMHRLLKRTRKEANLPKEDSILAEALRLAHNNQTPLALHKMNQYFTDLKCSKTPDQWTLGSP